MADVQHSTLHSNKSNLHRSYADITDFTPNGNFSSSSTNVDLALKDLAGKVASAAGASVKVRAIVPLSVGKYDIASGAERFIPFNMANPTQFTLPEDGVYLIAGNIIYSSNTGYGCFLRVWKNSTKIHGAGGMSPHTVGDTVNIPFATTIQASAGDYISVSVFGGSGGGFVDGNNENMDMTSGSNNLTITKL